jgi:hypothetical protein
MCNSSYIMYPFFPDAKVPVLNSWKEIANYSGAAGSQWGILWGSLIHDDSHRGSTGIDLG